MSRMGLRFQEEGKEWRLVLCGELEEDLKVMVGCFARKRRGVKFNENKSKVMVLSEEERLI